MWGPFTPGPTDDPNMGVYTGDAMELGAQLPDASIALVFSDPVYEIMEQYEWLAQLANRVLQPNRAMLAYYGNGYAADTFDAVRRGGRPYTWNLGEYQPGPRRGGQYHFSHWHCLGWFGGKPLATFVDMQPPDNDYGAESLHRTKKGERGHKWRKPIGPAMKFIKAFTKPGDVILDPFCGHGGLLEAALKAGRRYIGFEIEPEKADFARARVYALHNPPLLKLMEQPEADSGALLPISDQELVTLVDTWRAVKDNHEMEQLALLLDA